VPGRTYHDTIAGREAAELQKEFREAADKQCRTKRDNRKSSEPETFKVENVWRKSWVLTVCEEIGRRIQNGLIPRRRSAATK
jgi:hypothetical protein